MKQRRSPIALAAMGALASALLGSGLFALVGGTATSEGNTIQSGTLPIPGPDLRAAIIGEDDPCDATTTQDVATFASVISSSGFTPEVGSRLSSQRVCLYNAGASDGWAQLQFGNVYSAEANTVDGQCDNAEGFPTGGNDTTCGLTDPGELPAILWLTVQYPPDPADACPGICTAISPPSYAFPDVVTTPVQLKKLAPGEAISFHLDLGVACCDDSDQQRTQAAQTDYLQWDITFALLDQEPIS
jgi:hypothetical protein